jgi:apolipoprotein N-acyltransferase
MIFSTVTFADKERLQPLNTALALSPQGAPRGRYDKIELVPFGEHVPYAWLFSFAGKLTAEVGDFVPGRRYALLEGPQQSKIAALVCYEAGFPGLVRKLTSRGALALVNLSNDGWYGDSAARAQHLLMARMRTIENDRWMLRATNDGITAVIDPHGRAEVFEGKRRAVYAARYGLRTSETLYTRFGDWFAYLAVAWSCAVVALSRRKNP